MSTKTIAVLGITGNQGTSVANTFLSLPNWHVRGITRDPSKASAQAWISKGAEIVAGDLDDIPSLTAAFKGAHVVFGMTDFWVHMKNPATQERADREGRTPNEVAYDREVEQGKAIVDAVAANTDTVERFVLSTLSDATKWSKGKNTFNLHFDAKWRAVDYLNERYPELAKKTSLLQLGFFTSNWKEGAPRPRKQEDGRFKVVVPMSGEKRFPLVDPVADTGELTKALVELPPGKNLIGAGSVPNWNEWCETWGRINGVECYFEQAPSTLLEELLGPMLGRELNDMFEYVDEFGYDGSDPTAIYPKELGIEGKLMSMETYLKQQDWSSILSGQ